MGNVLGLMPFECTLAGSTQFAAMHQYPNDDAVYPVLAMVSATTENRMCEASRGRGAGVILRKRSAAPPFSRAKASLP
jgi:hypothetical protein